MGLWGGPATRRRNRSEGRAALAEVVGQAGLGQQVVGQAVLVGQAGTPQEQASLVLDEVLAA